MACAGAAGAVILLTSSALMSEAQAGAFGLRDQSAYGEGLAFAGMAAGGSLSSMFWNPATLSAVMGFQTETSATFVAPRASIDVLSPFTSNEGDVVANAALVSGYDAYRINDRVVLGLAITEPFGMRSKYDFGSELRNQGIAGTSSITTFNINPMLSVDLTDWLSVGAGFQAQYLDIRYTGVGASLGQLSVPGVPLPLSLGANASLDGDSWAYGYNVGVLLKPREGTEIGIGYRSGLKYSIDSKLTGSVTGSLLGQSLLTVPLDLDATAKLETPAKLSVGVRQAITDRWRVMGGVEWDQWSRFKQVSVQAKDKVAVSGVGEITVPEQDIVFGYDDGWFFSGGTEYDVSPKWTLRAGVAYELSPVGNSARQFRLPDVDRVSGSAGFTYKACERCLIDASYAYVAGVGDDHVQSSSGAVRGEVNADAHIVSLGFRYRFGGTPTGSHAN
ncbi:OmpP1/FadL family transporter [Faunimonas pinastri]|uniref:OmpP1/FadL family transporter n=1 Tax=Faunimonas pinastri TaxID=1855383 RepID=UPI0015A62972|nr:outer membrane protein transport protein [Faunimonas pinastri]